MKHHFLFKTSVTEVMLFEQVEEALLNAKVRNEEESPTKIAIIQQIIMAINALSKVFIYHLNRLCGLNLCAICIYLFCF